MGLAIVLIGVGLTTFIRALPSSAMGRSAMAGWTQLFALDSQQLWWFVTRAAGIIAYLLLWFSTAWGLLIPTKLLVPALDQTYTVDFHEYISLLAIGFTILHIFVLTVDRYLPYTWAQIIVPFLSPYRPLWVGFGVISFYLILLVTITFYLRSKIGVKTFKSIHLLSLVSYVGVTLHGIYAGTDAPLGAMKLMYMFTGLSITYLLVYWLVGKHGNEWVEKLKAIGWGGGKKKGKKPDHRVQRRYASHSQKW